MKFGDLLTESNNKKVKRVFITDKVDGGTSFSIKNYIDVEKFCSIYKSKKLGECDTYNIEVSFVKLINKLNFNLFDAGDTTDVSKFLKFWNSISDVRFELDTNDDKKAVFYSDKAKKIYSRRSSLSRF